MRSSNLILAVLSFSSRISALAAPRSAALEKDCQCSAMESVCHKASHINCCNGSSCEIMDNPNGDYGICRASNDRKKDEKCMCSMSDDVCHPKSDINCCFGLFCDISNDPNGDYGKCKPSYESKNPLKKIEDAEKCLESGSMHCNLRGAPPCCSGAKCNKVGRSNSQMFMCEKESDDKDQDGEAMCLKPGSMHCNYLRSPNCCSGSKCNKIGKSDRNMFMCEKESDDDDKKQCLVPGAHHCNISGMECCPGSSCKNVSDESFMCAKDSDDDDDDISTTVSQDQQPLFSSKDKNIFEEDCDRNMCIEGGQKSAMSKEKNKVMTENCAPQEPTGCSPFGCPCKKDQHNSCCRGQSCTGMSESGMSYCMTPDDQKEEHSRLYALKGMFHGFVEKIEKYCLPQGELCIIQNDKCCHGLMCHSGECMAENDELKL